MAEVLLDLLNSDSSVDDLSNQVKKIVQSIKSLQDLFDNLHRWSKAQNNEISYEPEEFDLNDVANNVFESSLPQSNNKNIVVKSNIHPKTLVFGDRNMIETVVRNLVSNSIKFTESGGSVTINHNRDDNGDNIVYVKDNGIGMSDD